MLKRGSSFSLEQEIKPSYYMGDSDAQESFESMLAMAEARSSKLYLLIDMKNIKGASAWARRTLSGISPEIVKGGGYFDCQPCISFIE